MKIDGIDPLLLNRIKEYTGRMEVQRTETTTSDNRVSRDRGQSGDNIFKPVSKDSEKKVEAALNRLNEEAEKDGIALKFGARKDRNLWYVDIFDRKSNELIREIPTDSALGVMNRIQSLFGVLLDEKR